ncbi:replicative DNA helicase [Aquirufa nivalisilvae]|uniref:replicative DNA helicase n=1 Tax=Aquirufa nivalisilvae TaxID=2516557 RepID=UPI00103295E4|nr:replicative DNA helicase [Aquirufa nivalisilvae]TBH73877.1 replicative DNA helicase [Aquirufa nivalisilvae]
MESNNPSSISKKANSSYNRSNQPARLSDLGLGKLPPQAPELEEVLLGALMLEKEPLANVIELLKPETFYKEAHQKIFQAIQGLFQASQPVDLLTVNNYLKVNGDLEKAGGTSYLAQLTSRVSSTSNVEFHARIIIEQFIKRQLIHVSSEIQRLAYEDTTDVFQILDRMEQELFSIAESNIRKNYESMSDILKKAIDELEKKQKQKSGLTGIPSGFTELDRHTSGWQKQELIIIAARPGMGKTAFVVSACRNAALDFGHAVALFSLEMSSIQLVNRIVSAEAEIEAEKIRKGKLEPHEWQQLHTKIDKLFQAPIYIDDTPALSILELRAKCRRLKAQKNIELIVIDYLQLMTGDTSGKGASGNREQEIAQISRALKQLAKELDVPVIALSQLNRSTETRGGNKKPQLSDLRESGAIEQDADQVMFIYRPEYYGITTDEQGNSIAGMGEIIMAKNRSGSLENVWLKFIGKFTKYCDLDFQPFADGNGNGVFNLSELGDTASQFEQGNSDSVFKGSKMNLPPADFDPLNEPF